MLRRPRRYPRIAATAKVRGMTRSDPNPLTGLQLKLHRLWKGTLLTAIAVVYVLLLVRLFVAHGWRDALIALVVVVVAQAFRHIATEVERIGWRIDKGLANDHERARPTQQRLFAVLTIAVQLTHLALAAQAWLLDTSSWVMATVASLAVVEVLFAMVRRANRRVGFQAASYGTRETTPVTGPYGHSHESADDILEERLTTLHDLAAAGSISQAAYEQARDRYRIRHVMAEFDPPPDRHG